MDKWQQWWINSAWACQNPALESINKAVLKTDGFILSFIPFQSRDANEATSLCTMTLTHCVLTPVRSWTDAGSECQHAAAFPQDWVIITKTAKKHESSCWITTEVNCNRHQSYVIPVIRYLCVFALDSLQKAKTWGFDCWQGERGRVAETNWNLVRFYRHGNCSIKSDPLPVYIDNGQNSVGIGGRCSLFGNWQQNFSWGNHSFNCSS